MNNINNKSIILFDGVCNLCNSSVNFIIKHDKKERYLFASLQSDAAKDILLQQDSKKINLDSIILIENNKIYKKSTAVLHIAAYLNKGYPLLYMLIIIPQFIRDFVYNYIAKNRYKWFGKTDSCMVPNKKYENYFLG